MLGIYTNIYLQELLLSDQYKLDWPFKFAFIRDITCVRFFPGAY